VVVYSVRDNEFIEMDTEDRFGLQPKDKTTEALAVLAMERVENFN
jgi:hypothetical protein